LAVSGTVTTSSGLTPMHFEVLVEDRSGSIALNLILKKILGTDLGANSWRIHDYRGAGRIPRGLRGTTDPQQRILLDRLPQLLRGYGKSLQDSSAVIVVVDLDRRNCMTFKQKLRDVLAACDPRPRTLFRIAIEESEAWLLGDHKALKKAYPMARDSVLNGYKQDSICGTWEVLADAVNRGGSAPLKRAGYPEAGQAKCEWARNIAPHMDVDQNQSKSFQVFRDGIRKLAGIG
jgi:hypothetical protein